MLRKSANYIGLYGNLTNRHSIYSLFFCVYFSDTAHHTDDGKPMHEPGYIVSAGV